MGVKNVNLRIYGMTCDDCVRTVTSGLREQIGVIDAKISLTDKTGIVTIDPDTISPDDLLSNRVFSKSSHYRAILIDQQNGEQA
ncbi:MAG: heavy-metal-associated domain-containing protein [Thermoplasmata archaeon]